MSIDKRDRKSGRRELPVHLPQEEVRSPEISQQQSTDIKIQETANGDNTRKTIEEFDNLEYPENSEFELTITKNEAEASLSKSQGSSYIQDAFVSVLTKDTERKSEYPELPVQLPQQVLGSPEISIGLKGHNTNITFQEAENMITAHGNNRKIIVQEDENLEKLENSDCGLTITTSEAEESASGNQETSYIHDSFISIMKEATERILESPELPVQLAIKEIYEKSDSQVLPPKYPSISENTLSHISDIPVSKVRITNSKDVHIGPRISYVTKIVQARTSSNRQKCEDLMESDDAVLLFSSKLRLSYTTENAYMPSLAGCETSNDVSIRDCYLLPRIDEYNDSGKVKRKNIPLKDIFVSDERGMPAKRILLTGNRGCGKTSTLKKIAFDWATLNSKNNYLSNFDIVLIINLATLIDRTVEEIILEALFENRDEKRQGVLHKTNLQFLILLDGFDHLVTSQPVIDFLTAKQSCIFAVNMTIVVTSRLRCIMPIRKCFQCHFHIKGFSKDEKEKYIDFRFSTKTKLNQEFKTKLKKGMPLSDISITPLILHLLCSLYKDKKLHGDMNEYAEMLYNLVGRYDQKYGWSSQVLKHGKSLFRSKPIRSIWKHCSIVIK